MRTYKAAWVLHGVSHGRFVGGSPGPRSASRISIPPHPNRYPRHRKAPPPFTSAKQKTLHLSTRRNNPKMTAAQSQSDELRNLLISLHDIGAFILRDTKLKSGLVSPFYVDLRVTVSHPAILNKIARCLEQVTAEVPHQLLCGVPYTALPFATAMSVHKGVPMVMRRKERKEHGTGKVIEGVFEKGMECLVVEDLVTSGGSVLETVESLREVGIVVKHAVVLLDREQGAKENLLANGIQLHAVTTVSSMLAALKESGRISDADMNKVLTFISAAQVSLPNASKPMLTQNVSYEIRSANCKSLIAQRLFSTMASKCSNLCVAADVTTSESLLKLADLVGPRIAVLKTHADIIQDWDPNSTPQELRKLADKHNFLIFEDRKFADIGNTVVNQLAGGIHRISSWADFVNAHALPGPGIIAGLKKAAGGGDARPFGLILLAEMSSKGNLATSLPGYTQKTIAMAEEDSDFVFGFISMGRLEMKNADNFVFITPGVKLVAGDDPLGQQYNTPEKAIAEKGTDVIVVGRGIYQASDPGAEAEKYRVAGWNAYLKRLEQ